MQEARLRTLLRGKAPWIAAAAFIRTVLLLADPEAALPRAEVDAAGGDAAGGSAAPTASREQRQAAQTPTRETAGPTPAAARRAQHVTQEYGTRQQEQQLGQRLEQQHAEQQSEVGQAQQSGRQTGQQQAQSGPSSLQLGGEALMPTPLKQGQAEHAQAMDTGLEDLLLGAAGAAAAAAAGLTYELAAAFLVLPAEQLGTKASNSREKGGQQSRAACRRTGCMPLPAPADPPGPATCRPSRHQPRLRVVLPVRARSCRQALSVVLSASAATAQLSLPCRLRCSRQTFRCQRYSR